MFTLFYLQVANAMNDSKNYHSQNPYYRPATAGLGYVFANAMRASYNALNARWWLPENIGIGSVKDRIANEEAEAAYEKQLVRISQPFIPSQCPHYSKTLCQMFADERPVEITDDGGIQYRMNLRDTE
jgi:hypothetical protein